MDDSSVPRDVKYSEEFITNSSGLKLFTCKWIPGKQDPKGLVFICHGYAMECSITMQGTAIRLAKVGFSVFGIDYQGHGKSEGLKAYIHDFNHLVDDCHAHFTAICEKEENKGKRKFLLGESMGGAVSLMLERKRPDFWDGAILSAPMCKIADEMKPPAAVVSLLKGACWLVPTWKGVHIQDIVEVAFKEPLIREQIRNNRYCYKGAPRIKTSFELLKASTDIEQTLEQVKIPFIVLHGEMDKVTEPNVSRELYESASSKDKTIKLYPGMWHGLLYGEPPQNIDIVFRDIIDWLEVRTTPCGPMSEREKKLTNDASFSSKVKSG